MNQIQKQIRSIAKSMPNNSVRLDTRARGIIRSLNLIEEGIAYKLEHSFKRGSDGKRVVNAIPMLSRTIEARKELARLQKRNDKWIHVSIIQVKNPLGGFMLSNQNIRYGKFDRKRNVAV